MDVDGVDPLRDDDVLVSPPAGKAIRFDEKPVDPEQDEVLTVVDGRLWVVHGGDRRRLDPGETVTVPAGDRHRFWNAGETRLHLRGGSIPASGPRRSCGSPTGWPATANP
jgi:mannose-6-phosphate isomerase-like protein (cupin superfamily)